MALLCTRRCPYARIGRLTASSCLSWLAARPGQGAARPSHTHPKPPPWPGPLPWPAAWAGSEWLGGLLRERMLRGEKPIHHYLQNTEDDGGVNFAQYACAEVGTDGRRAQIGRAAWQEPSGRGSVGRVGVPELLCEESLLIRYDNCVDQGKAPKEKEVRVPFADCQAHTNADE